MEGVAGATAGVAATRSTPAADVERRAALNVLRTHAAMLRAGRIDLDEWFRRVDRVYQARFLGEPALPPSRPDARP